MKIDKTTLEWILIASISVVLVFTFVDFGDEPTKEEVIMESFDYEDFPLVAWFDTEEKWDGSMQHVVKIKYRVFNHNSRIWIYDINGSVVHKQPYDRDPKDDGTPRDFTYSWRLYKSEWSDAIQSGDYIITMGFGNPGSGDNQRRITITI